MVIIYSNRNVHYGIIVLIFVAQLPDFCGLD